MSALLENVRIRWVFCLAIIGGSLLLIGAGRMSSEKRMISRRTVNREACRETASSYSGALPSGSREAWGKLLEKNPELALRAETGRLYEIGSVR